MWWLGDKSEAAVTLLAAQLLVPSHRHGTINALLINATDASTAILLKHISKEYDCQVAAILVNDKRTRDEAIALVKKSILTGHAFESEIEIRELLHRVKDTTVLKTLFADCDVQEIMRQTAICQEGSGWVVGTKATAISALGLVNPTIAYEAARAALQNDGSHDREMYPFMMVQFDANRSIGDLIEQAKMEQHTSVLWSIGRALSKTDCLEAVKALLDSIAQNDREVGCKLCACGTFSENLEKSLRHLLKDASSNVARMAREALETVESRRKTDRLVKAILQEKDTCHRWTLLDAIIASDDPGDERQVWPEWARMAHRISNATIGVDTNV